MYLKLELSILTQIIYRMFSKNLAGCCLSTRVPRHSWRCMFVVPIICNAQARVMEAETSITLIVYTSINVFIALSWHSENDYGFYL